MVEAVLVVVVIALAVPVTLRALDEAGRSARHAARVERASTFAGAIMETVTADAHSPLIGFNGISAPEYLSDPAAGLDTRIVPLVELYAADGLTHELEIGEASDADGSVTGDPARDVFRAVTVRVSWTDTRGQESAVEMTTLVGDLVP